MVLSTVKYRRTAVLAILSVLLLFIAPLVSTSLSLLKHPSSQHHALQACGMSMEAEGEMSSAEIPAKHPLTQGLSETGSLCGYCDLLIHMPFFLWLATALLWLLTQLSRLRPALLDYTILCSPFYSAHRSRGPPKLLGV